MRRWLGLSYQLWTRSVRRSISIPLLTTGNMQVFVDQKNCDVEIIHLAGTMSDVFAFVHDAEPLKAINAHMKTITLLIQQVTECGYFITEYIKRKNFCPLSFTSHHNCH